MKTAKILRSHIMAKPRLTTDPARSRTMSRIRGKDTSIETALRKALWHSGIRYRKNYSGLPGKPDIAITKHRIAVFCDGDFWHGKEWDTKKLRIKNNSEFWLSKIERNMNRDVQTDRVLFIKDWTVLRFWGTEIEKDLSGCVDEIRSAILYKEMESSSYDDEHVAKCSSIMLHCTRSANAVIERRRKKC
jgi:DNA mismatch endonuclease (patch repair protein)